MVSLATFELRQRHFPWLNAVSASPRGLFPRAGNLRGVTRTLLGNGDAFLSRRRSSQQVRHGPHAMLAFPST